MSDNRSLNSIYQGNQVLKVVSIGSIANRMLTEGRIWVIHSVFEHAFNAMASGGDLLSFVSRDLYRGPINLVVDFSKGTNMYDLGVMKGQELVRIGSLIILRDTDILFSLESCKVWRADGWNRKPLDLIRLKHNLVIAANVYKDLGKAEGLGQLIFITDCVVSDKCTSGSGLNDFSKVTLPTVRRLVQAFFRSDIGELRLSVKDLVGLGPGLTPSGDDMLSGLMASSVLVAKYFDKNVREVLKINKMIMAAVKEKGTTLLSEEQMKYSALGLTVEPVREVIRALLMSDEKKVVKATTNLLGVGSCSGEDILLGILLFMNAYSLRYTENLLQAAVLGSHQVS